MTTVRVPVTPEAGAAVAAVRVLYVHASGEDAALVGERLAALGATVTSVGSLRDALAALADAPFNMCLVDLSERTSASAIRALRAQDPELPIAGIIDPTRPLVAADALNSGVTDLLSWPFDEREVAAAVANARDRGGDTPVPPVPAVPGVALVAHSPSMRLMMESIREAAPGRGGVIIAGEPGSGRGLVARAVHLSSPQRDNAFVVVNAAGLAPDELETALFGVPPDKRHPGLGRRVTERITRAGAFFRANGGTLFIANVVEVADRVQAKLARLLRDREATLNEKRAVMSIDVRLMVSMAADPDSAVADGRLRRDLFERLAHVRVDVPPLRRRREDIPMLAVHLVGELAHAADRPAPRFTRSALALLAALPWPGNGRELHTVLETVLRAVRRPVIEIDDLFAHVKLDGVAARIDASGTLRDARARFERDWISAVLIKHHGRVGEAARALGIQRTNLYRKVRQLNVARTLLAPRRT